MWIITVCVGRRYSFYEYDSKEEANEAYQKIQNPNKVLTEIVYL